MKICLPTLQTFSAGTHLKEFQHLHSFIVGIGLWSTFVYCLFQIVDFKQSLRIPLCVLQQCGNYLTLNGLVQLI